jgi:hypothetical protein
VTAAAEFFAALPEHLSTADDSIGPAVIAFALDGAPDGGWTLRLGGDGPAVAAGVAPADVTVTCTRTHWEQLCDGSLSPQTAWATGLLEVSGDMRLAQRLRALLGI